jgi:LacI family transcriptional regulator
MAMIMDERPTRERQGTTGRVSRARAAASAAARAGGKVALFLDGHNPVTRQVALGVMEFVRTRRGGSQASRSSQALRWSIVLANDLVHGLGDGVPSVRDGFVGAIGCLGDPRLAATVKAGSMPVVGVACCCEPEPIRSLGLTAQVVLDEERIAALAAEHLIACGLMSLAYVTTGQEREARGLAFARHAKSAQRSCHVERLAEDAGKVSRGDVAVVGSSESKVGQLCRWLESQKVPVGVLACDDAHARLVIDACRRVGRRVPEEVAVIGVGNDDLLCEAAVPPLSSIDPGFFQLGTAAAATLDAILRPRRGRAVESRVEVAAIGPVARRSTDMLAIADEQVAEAVRIVRGRPAADFTVDVLAAQLGLSRSTLEQRFRRAVGCSVHDEMVRSRLAEVRRIIGNPELTMKQVAAASGFGSVSYMTTFLKKHLGMTPGQLRGIRH